MRCGELEDVARDGELRVEVDRVLGRVLATLHADRAADAELERARAHRNLGGGDRW